MRRFAMHSTVMAAVLAFPIAALAQPAARTEPPSGLQTPVANELVQAINRHCLASWNLFDELQDSLEDVRDAADLKASQEGMTRVDHVIRNMAEQLGRCSDASRVLPRPQSPAAGTEAGLLDPVCRMPIDGKSSITATHQGKTYYFCSEHDRAAFQKDPAKYIGRDRQ
jgi:YHS domain-containing protein